MDRETIVEKNLDLHAEWMRYVFEHPEVLDQIPDGAQVVILPTDDPELAAENRKTVEAAKLREKPVVAIHMASPRPQTPKLEVLV